ncbi:MULTISPECIES: hypothetical protein [Paenibacillus]|uniref:hypothetical protein n=1 Tax=Paenibacillus TaxID=44249 RepID=UPI0003A307C2|nr:hypothetical protein [Paenibacillus massiliensis]
MKVKKVPPLRRWSHLMHRLPKLLRSSRVPWREKLLFLIPIALYWVLPDVLIPIPFMPLDDIAISVLLLTWFVKRVERKYPDLLV